MVKPVPEGLTPLIPQLVSADAEKLIAFLEKAFGARLEGSMPGPDGKSIMHAHVRIEGLPLFIAGPFGPAPATQANLFLYVADVDAAYARAVKAGAKAVVPVADMPWGDRWGMVGDPFGNMWQIATHKEDVSPEEMKRRMMQPR
jgi:uncharacterized glyoxalase superfamily protein PhnB